MELLMMLPQPIVEFTPAGNLTVMYRSRTVVNSISNSTIWSKQKHISNKVITFPTIVEH